MMFSHTPRVEENISSSSGRLGGGNVAIKPASVGTRRVLGDITNHHSTVPGGLGGKGGKNSQHVQPDKAPVKTQALIRPIIKPMRAPSLRPVEYVTTHADDAEGTPFDATGDIIDRMRRIGTRRFVKGSPVPETPLALDLAEFDSHVMIGGTSVTELALDDLDLDGLLDM